MKHKDLHIIGLIICVFGILAIFSNIVLTEVNKGESTYNSKYENTDERYYSKDPNTPNYYDDINENADEEIPEYKKRYNLYYEKVYNYESNNKDFTNSKDEKIENIISNGVSITDSGVEYVYKNYYRKIDLEEVNIDYISFKRYRALKVLCIIALTILGARFVLLIVREHNKCNK